MKLSEEIRGHVREARFRMFDRPALRSAYMSLIDMLLEWGGRAKALEDELWDVQRDLDGKR